MFKLDWFGPQTMAKIEMELEQDIEDAAKMVATEARTLVPVKTGALKQSIRVAASKFEDGGFVVKAGGGDEYYASFVELGTKNKTARPFLRPALEKSRGQIKRMMKLK